MSRQSPSGGSVQNLINARSVHRSGDNLIFAIDRRAAGVKIIPVSVSRPELIWLLLPAATGTNRKTLKPIGGGFWFLILVARANFPSSHFRRRSPWELRQIKAINKFIFRVGKIIGKGWKNIFLPLSTKRLFTHVFANPHQDIFNVVIARSFVLFSSFGSHEQTARLEWSK